MKKMYASIFIVISVACFGQEQQEAKQPAVPTSLSIAVKQNLGWGNLNGPDFYNGSFTSVFRQYGYTFNIDKAFNNNAIYVDVNKYYNGTYIPVVAQMHNTNLGANNIYYYNDSNNTFNKAIGVNLSKIGRH
jgi:hypothetical protein